MGVVLCLYVCVCVYVCMYSAVLIEWVWLLDCGRGFVIVCVVTLLLYHMIDCSCHSGQNGGYC